MLQAAQVKISFLIFFALFFLIKTFLSDISRKRDINTITKGTIIKIVFKNTITIQALYSANYSRTKNFLLAALLNLYS